jgi:hypothetical protein
VTVCIEQLDRRTGVSDGVGEQIVLALQPGGVTGGDLLTQRNYRLGHRNDEDHGFAISFVESLNLVGRVLQ